MVDLTKIKYRVAVITESGAQYNIKDYIHDLGWEENENEIAVRISFKARDDKTSKGQLASLIKPGCLVGVFATDGGSHDGEVARGYVEKWNPSEQSSAKSLSCTCYDELYKFQKSQENLYYPEGTGTKSAITGILDSWEIPQDTYQGPNATHGKLTFKNKYLADIINELLDDAKKKGSQKCFIRAAKGKTSVLPRGTNTEVYVFKAESTKVVSSSMSTEDLVTRVKVIGQENDDGNSSVEATLNGLTKYGVRQRIYTRGSDEELSAAKSAAQEILDEDGNIGEEISVEAPDIPWTRKGDLVYLMVGYSSGYYYVKGIRHDASSMIMTLDLEKAKPETVSENKTEEKKSYSVGDIVNFHGGTHYVSSYSGAKGYSARAGKAKITLDPNCAGNGKAHPWHLIHTDSSSNVYGWVDEGTFD